MPASDLGYSACRSTDGSVRPCWWKAFLRLGNGIALAAFHTRGIALRPHRGARDRFLVRGEVRHDTEKCVARPWSRSDV